MLRERWRGLIAFALKWWWISGSLICMIAPLIVLFSIYWIFGSGYLKIAFVAAILSTVACIILVSIISYKRQKQDSGAAEEDYSTKKTTRRNLAKFKPDTVDYKRIEKIGRKYSKLPPPEE